MEIKSELKQPYTENERLKFIVEQNHKLGYEIREVETTYEVEEEVPHETVVTEIVETPIFDEDGNPVLDEEGNQVFEKQEVEKSVIEYTKETVKKTGYNLEAWGYTDEEIQARERERIDNLTLTAADVERAIYQSKGMDFDDILGLVAENPPEGVDIKALKIELKANNFVRKHPYINIIGEMLGYTSDDLDYLFENKGLLIK